MNELTPQHVEDVYTDCLANGTANTVDVQGIVHTSRFSLVKLLERKTDIAGLLSQLPMEFFPKDQGGGGGWSFLSACNDRDGQQWTGFHMTMEQLVVLRVATNQVHWCMPRELWSALPGEMPYFIVDGLERE